jgi:hypothetical protein
MKADVPPVAAGDDRRAQLIAILRDIGGDPGEAELIHRAMLDVMVQATGEGREIGADTVYYARPRRAVGPARDLRDLLRAAQKAKVRNLRIDEDWIAAWARLPAKTRQLVRLPKLIQTEDGRALDYMGYSAPGFTMIVPKPAIAMPGIEAALQRIKTTPGSKRRQPNETKDKAREKIWRAFQTGSVGGGVRARAFLEFGRAIDQIYGTDLFDSKDGRHLRRLGRAVGYNGPQT